LAIGLENILGVVLGIDINLIQELAVLGLLVLDGDDLYPNGFLVHADQVQVVLEVSLPVISLVLRVFYLFDPLVE